ncbi:unnamed protein product [Closterium sp. NIES-65]|nr:unnamed protein product [Closterium sp. NIES-65]
MPQYAKSGIVLVCDNQHGQLGRPAPSQDGTPAPVQGLEQLEVLLVVAGSQQGLVLCRALQGSEAALEPQEFDDTRVLTEEHVSPASCLIPGQVAGESWGRGVSGGAGGHGRGGGGGAGHVDEVWGGVQDAAPAGHGQQHAQPVLARAGGECGEKYLRQELNPHPSGPLCRSPFFSNLPLLPTLPACLSLSLPPRAGTQDLYRKLTSSIIPGIFPAAIPNPQWYDPPSPQLTSWRDRNGARDFAWYVALFDEAAQHMVNTGGSAVTGEASSTLLTSSGVVLRGHVDDRHTVPQLLHLVLPRSKFIVILRNPVDRFFSEFNLAAAVNPSVPRDFHKYSDAILVNANAHCIAHSSIVSASPPFAGPAAEQMVWETWAEVGEARRQAVAVVSSTARRLGRAARLLGFGLKSGKRAAMLGCSELLVALSKCAVAAVNARWLGNCSAAGSERPRPPRDVGREVWRQGRSGAKGGLAPREV